MLGCWEILSLIVSASFLPPLPFEEGVSSLALVILHYLIPIAICYEFGNILFLLFFLDALGLHCFAQLFS